MDLESDHYIWTTYNIGFNKEYLLRQTYARYTSLFDVKACEQADSFLSENSKEAQRQAEERLQNLQQRSRTAPAASSDTTLSLFEQNLREIQQRSRAEEQGRRQAEQLQQSLFMEACKSQDDATEEDKIKEIVFINPWTAKINITRKVQEGSKKVSTDYILTWVYENERWQRDWPD